MPRIVDHDARRLEIVRGAFEVFLERGYGGVKMKDLANDLGHGVGSLYHYFPSKRALFEAVQQWFTDQDLQRIVAIGAGRETPEQLLDAFIFYYADNRERLIRELRLSLDYLQTENDREAHGAVRRSLSAYWERLPNVLSAMNNGLSTSEVRGLATLVVAFVDGLSVHQLVGAEPPVADAMMVFKKLVMQYLEKGEAQRCDASK
jgi:AcrR family transcriptional regulator